MSFPPVSGVESFHPTQVTVSYHGADLLTIRYLGYKVDGEARVIIHELQLDNKGAISATNPLKSELLDGGKFLGVVFVSGAGKAQERRYLDFFRCIGYGGGTRIVLYMRQGTTSEYRIEKTKGAGKYLLYRTYKDPTQNPLQSLLKESFVLHELYDDFVVEVMNGPFVYTVRLPIPVDLGAYSKLR
jgi:hypothetical protein